MFRTLCSATSSLPRLSQRAMSTTSSAIAPLLVSPSALTGHLSSPKPPVLLDASWHMPNSSRNASAEYAAGPRLPGARRFDVDEIADRSYAVEAREELGAEGGKVLLPHMFSPRKFVESVGKLGVRRDDWVVVYDSVGVFSSPRAAWTFRAMNHPRVSILDGGLPRWSAEGFLTESGPPTEAEEVEYHLDARPQKRVANYEDLVANFAVAEGARALVLDARSVERFQGTAPEPRPKLSSGHIPYSLSLPFNAVLSPSSPTTFLPPSRLEDVFALTLGSELWADVKNGKKPLITSCGSGMTAAVLWAALRIVGVAEERMSLYDESWTGYASRKGSMIIKS